MVIIDFIDDHGGRFGRGKLNYHTIRQYRQQAETKTVLILRRIQEAGGQYDGGAVSQSRQVGQEGGDVRIVIRVRRYIEDQFSGGGGDIVGEIAIRDAIDQRRSAANHIHRRGVGGAVVSH